MQIRALPAQILQCGRHTITLNAPVVMGILNVTPDSFSDGGQFATIGSSIEHAQRMLADGATIIDIGGESTRPHAAAVSTQQEMDRILPVIEALSHQGDCVISVDTSSPEVFRAAHQLGAHLWNDVRALTRPSALQVAAELNVPVVLMHMRGEPSTMNELAVYDDVTQTVKSELQVRIDQALAAGIAKHNIILDAGFGFAKTTTHNLQLLDNHWQLADLGFAMMIGVSRKRFLGEILRGAAVDERKHAGLSAAMLGVLQGASIIRTHDVKATVDAMRVWQAVQALHLQHS